MSREYWLVLLLEATGEANVSGGYFCAELVTQPTVYPFFYCELYAMLCRGLSKCLHLLMWVNQHRRAVGVWIPNTGGRTGPFLGGFAHLSVSPAVGLCLWGESNPSEFWQPGTLMGSGVCERSPSSTLGIQPRGKKLGGHKECSLKSLLISPCSAKASFLVRLNI